MKILTIVLTFLAAPVLLFAGDGAIFTSLGFSKEGRYFAFAQYGEQDGSGFPYAELYIVDVEKNDFVSGGVIKNLWKDQDDPQARGIHVLLETRSSADSLLKKYGIDAKRQPHFAVSHTADERDLVEWKSRDGILLGLKLEQQGDGELGMFNSAAAFQLLLSQNKKLLATIGNFKRFRKHVIRYDIDRVLTSEDDIAVIVVVRMTSIGFEGPNIRYMVETFTRRDKTIEN